VNEQSMVLQKEMRMTYGRTVFATTVLIVALGSGLAGCKAGPLWRASQQMCMAQGGTYSSATQKCTFAAGTEVSAQDACQNLAGVYFAENQRCRFDE
jgi:hypothetical protein